MGGGVEAAQSGGSHGCMLLDKMDQRKPWRHRSGASWGTPLFKEVDKRLVTILIGPMWFGKTQTTHLVRIVFDDCQHGSGMQSNAHLHNLHQVAMEEERLPTHWPIGADNARKETNNQTTMWFLTFLRCALEGTPMWMIDVIVLWTHPQQT